MLKTFIFAAIMGSILGYLFGFLLFYSPLTTILYIVEALLLGFIGEYYLKRRK